MKWNGSAYVIEVGDRVKHVSVMPRNGKVIEVSPNGKRVRVHWEGEPHPDQWNRPTSEVEVVL